MIKLVRLDPNRRSSMKLVNVKATTPEKTTRTINRPNQVEIVFNPNFIILSSKKKATTFSLWLLIIKISLLNFKADW